MPIITTRPMPKTRPSLASLGMMATVRQIPKKTTTSLCAVCRRTCLGLKQLRYWAPSEYGVLVRPHLEELAYLGKTAMPVNDIAWLGAGTTILVNGRWLPPEGHGKLPDSPCLGVVGGEVAFALV